GVGLSSLVDYAWEISIGDESVGLEELRRLAEQGVPLIRIGDRWVEIRKEDFEKANTFLGKHPGGASTLGDVLRLAAGGEDGDAPPITSIRTEGWVRELLGEDGEAPEDRVKPITVPEAFKGTLRPYQERGLAWLAFLDRFGLGGCLADDMGLGKTIQMIALLQHEREERTVEMVRPTLLVCPMSVAGNWRRELERFAPELRVHVQHGPDRPVGEGFVEKANNCDVVVTTYALVSRDRAWIENVEWERVVLDEAQHVKNPPTKQATAIRSIKSRHRVALTGTPVENRLTELWSIMEFCLPGFLGPQAEFRRRFAIPIERHRDERRGDRLKQLVGPFVLRRLKTDDGVADDLPPLVENRQHVPLTPEQARLYDTVVQDMLRQVDEATGMRRRGLVLSGLVRLKQICNHPAHYLRETDSAPNPDERLSQRSGKTSRLVELLEEVLANSDQALVFTQFRQMGHLLSTILRQEFDMEPLFLHGGTPQGRRDQMIERFQAGEASPIFLLSLKAGGVGVNLTSANHVIHFDRWWNPAVENQATDRAFRIGQTRTVNVHKMITNGTLEERIDQMIEQKTDLARRIIGTGESWLTELDSDRLREVLTLRENSLDEEDG
ncbi:MAG: DEAD/DEAH box helicase, partial [Planctomycetota bacterium]|nr:DEAD/DEAH box helicase [Planctomycetota bacterium]